MDVGCDRQHGTLTLHTLINPYAYLRCNLVNLKPGGGEVELRRTGESSAVYLTGEAFLHRGGVAARAGAAELRAGASRISTSSSEESELERSRV